MDNLRHKRKKRSHHESQQHQAWNISMDTAIAIATIELLFEITLLVFYILAVTDVKVISPTVLWILIGVITVIDIGCLIFFAVAPTLPKDQNPFYYEQEMKKDVPKDKHVYLNLFSSHFAKLTVVNLTFFILIAIYHSTISSTTPTYPFTSAGFPGESLAFILCLIDT